MDCVKDELTKTKTPTRGKIPQGSRPHPTLGKVVQLEGCPCGGDEDRLAGSLSRYVGDEKEVRLVLTDNRHTIVSVRRRPARYDVRVHRLFSQADDQVVESLSRYILRNDHEAANLLGAFIDGHREKIEARPKRQRKVCLRTQGHHHDLQAIFDELNARYFGQKIQARITWGPHVRKQGRLSIKVGSYSVEDRLIRVHPALDRGEVPRFFVEWTVFHEMLHAKHPIQRVGKRRCFHSKDFLREERNFAERQVAMRWEKENLGRLLDA